VTKKAKSVRIAAGTYVVEIEGQFDGVVVKGENVLLRCGDITNVKVVKQARIAESRDVGSDVDVDEVAYADIEESQRDKVIVDLYCGAAVLSQMNSKGRNRAKHVRLLTELNAIEDVVVNFREAGPGNEISKAIVRDLWMRSRRDAVAPEWPSEKQVTVTAVLRAAGIPKIRWVYGGGTTIHDVTRVDESAGTRQPIPRRSSDESNEPTCAVVMLMHSEVPDGNAMQQAATSVVLGQLTARDYAGVLTFTPGGAKWAWGENHGLVQIGERRADLIKSILDSTVADSPEYDTALRMALDAFVNVKAAKKQMLILTNGDPSLRNPAILNQLKENGIAITVVHVTNYGTQYAKVPRQIADSTGGKYIYVDADTVKTSTIEELLRSEIERSDP